MIEYPYDEIDKKNIGLLYDYKCYPWVFNNVCLIGDAAHQIYPYFGQVINAGLEDITILAKLMERFHDWKTITENF